MNNNPSTESPNVKVLTVSHLIREMRDAIEPNFKNLWLTGEITNFSAATSGHWYFSLKDDRAQIRCAMFRGKNRFCRFRPKDGQQVTVRANASIYEARGDLQLIVEWMEPSGVGALQLAFLQLKEKLQNEGLFAPERKKKLPDKIEVIGIVTSTAGAAIHDIISVLKRRDPFKHVIIYPASVQGKEAAKSLIQAVQVASARNEVDVLVITRGGGSLEDLWCFNDEQLARVIADCPIPTISAVGHEVDFTICDWVADLRLPTPSAAAEYLSNDINELRQRIQTLAQRLTKAMWRQLNDSNQRVDWLWTRLPKPHQLMQQAHHHVKHLEWRLDKTMRRQLSERFTSILTARARLSVLSPSGHIRQYQTLLNRLAHQARAAIHNQIQAEHKTLARLAGHLQGVSPLATLKRGYSITEIAHNGQLVRDDTQIAPDTLLRTRLNRRTILSQYVGEDGPPDQ